VGVYIAFLISSFPLKAYLNLNCNDIKSKTFILRLAIIISYCIQNSGSRCSILTIYHLFFRYNIIKCFGLLLFGHSPIRKQWVFLSLRVYLWIVLYVCAMLFVRNFIYVYIYIEWADRLGVSFEIELKLNWQGLKKRNIFNSCT